MLVALTTHKERVMSSQNVSNTQQILVGCFQIFTKDKQVCKADLFKFRFICEPTIFM